MTVESSDSIKICDGFLPPPRHPRSVSALQKYGPSLIAGPVGAGAGLPHPNHIALVKGRGAGGAVETIICVDRTVAF